MPAGRADQDWRSGAIPSGHLGGIGVDLMALIGPHKISRIWAGAAPPSVIGGPASDFTEKRRRA
jgi:hypothetical protein